MVISFTVSEAREQLEAIGFVYTLRPYRRKNGRNWYNYCIGCPKQGDVFIHYIDNFIDKEEELERFVKKSGFNTLKDWLKKAKKSRYLYEVELI